jgi:hypothetical protein
MNGHGTGTRRRLTIPAGLLGMLALVAGVELALGHPERVIALGDQWYWRTVARDADRVAGRDLLVLGDSLVKLGVAPGVIQQQTGRRGYNLAVGGGQAPATYHLLKRALDRGARPSAILVDFFPRLMQLDADHNRANWAQLLGPREGLELAWNAGRADWAGAFLLQKLFPSVAHREEFRKSLKLALNGQPDPKYAGPHLRHTMRLHAGVQALPPGAGDFKTPLTTWAEQYFGRLEFSRVNALYARKTIELAAARGITVYWLVPPMLGALEDELRRSGFDAHYTRFLERQVERSPNVVVVDARGAGYDPAVFFDPHHLGVTGAAAYSLALGEVLRRPPAVPAADRYVMLPPYRPAPAGISLLDPGLPASRLAGAAGASRR